MIFCSMHSIYTAPRVAIEPRDKKAVACATAFLSLGSFREIAIFESAPKGFAADRLDLPLGNLYAIAICLKVNAPRA